ncbi:ATP-binding protein [Cupriavidus sp. SW-Y-13]|uniref:ATP-binding protein n=1 Tax=Cupriavidus sp. SW-Y-13 TaxID=2653854 RepID=UPI001365B912|nr:HAMP domain-containing protein [Cupriavidus sp. SW-Y-13]
MKLVGLGRKISLWMTAVSLGMTFVVVSTSYIFYYVMMTYWPERVDETAVLPSGPEWVWLGATFLFGAVVAMAVARKLARKILVPLNSVADSMRRVSRGDLAARAVAGDRSLGEAASLADDFNALAARLQRVTEEQTFWNAAMAHELRTPVTVLRGRLQGLAEGVFPPTEALFRGLLTHVEGLSRMIEDLRVISLAESGHLDLHVQDMDLQAEIGEVLEFFGNELASADQVPVVKVTAPSVLGDPLRIRQALLALLDNARRYAGPGIVQIEAFVQDGTCHLRVRDHGPGIPQEQAAHVFSAFRRAGVARTAHRSGSGLGLAVVAAIAHAHSGTVICELPAGGGCAFEMRWPQALPFRA